MPLGNLTSQIFANIYLNELDHYVKEQLKVKYYIRYVDDFVILHKNKIILEYYQSKICEFLKTKLALELHPDKSKITRLSDGVNFLGFRIFPKFRLIRKKNLRKFEKKFIDYKKLYENGAIEREKIIEAFEGWLAYVKNADTYKYRRHITRLFNKYFPSEINIESKSVKKEENLFKKIETSNYQFTSQKTLKLLRKGLGIKQIAEQRQIKESTVWEHFSKLIEYGQLNVWRILPKYKIFKILSKIQSDNDKLKDIKERINEKNISFDEINCVLASIKYQNKKKRITNHFNSYRKLHCLRKCYLNPEQREICARKMDNFTSKNINLEMTKNEFLDLFNNHINICVLPKEEKLKFISWNEFKAKIKK